MEILLVCFDILFNLNWLELDFISDIKLKMVWCAIF